MSLLAAGNVQSRQTSWFCIPLGCKAKEKSCSESSCWRIRVFARTQSIAAKQDVVINSSDVHWDVCKTLENKPRGHLRSQRMAG